MSRIPRRSFGLAAGAAAIVVLAGTASAQAAVKVSNYRVTEIKQASTFRGSGDNADLAFDDRVSSSYTWKGNKKLNIAFVKNRQKGPKVSNRKITVKPQKSAQRGTTTLTVKNPSGRTLGGAALQSGSCNFAGKFQRTGPDATKVTLGAEAPNIGRAGRVRLQFDGGDAWSLMQAANASRCANTIFLPDELSDPFRLPNTPLVSTVFSTSQNNLRKRFRGKRELVVLRKRQKVQMFFGIGRADGGVLTLNTTIKMQLVGSRT